MCICESVRLRERAAAILDPPQGRPDTARMAFDAIVDRSVRRVPDFPKPGILFYDLTGLLTEPAAFTHVVDRTVELCSDLRVEAIAAIEARGFLFAAPAAYRLEVPLILLRKHGKLPGRTISREFALEYGTDRIEMHAGDVAHGTRVLVVDDLVATGGTVEAGCHLLEEAGAVVAGVFAVVELSFLPWRERLTGRDVRYLQSYDHE